jgi:tetratricopeptide (TPR) repeat protein
MEKGANVSRKKSRAKVYFIIAYVLLLTMALCWSLDNAIVLILFGGGAYFLFLGFYTNAQNNKSDVTENLRKPTSSTSFADGLKKLSSKQGIRYNDGTARPKVLSSIRPILPLIVLAVFGIFFIFLIGGIVGASGSDESSDIFIGGDEYYSQGVYDSAYLYYRRAWQADENDVEAMVGYGNVLAVRNQYDSAGVMYDMAFEIDPQYLDAAYAKGAMYYNLERYSECIALMDPVLRKNPTYYNGMLLIGDCYYALNQFDNAIVWYVNAYENGGMRSSALCHLMAYIYDSKGDNSKAIGLYQEALQYDSTIVDIYKRLGELLPNEDGNYYRTKAIKLGQQ